MVFHCKVTSFLIIIFMCSVNIGLVISIWSTLCSGVGILYFSKELYLSLQDFDFMFIILVTGFYVSCVMIFIIYKTITSSNIPTADSSVFHIILNILKILTGSLTILNGVSMH